jgi:hypothetical protein
MTFTLEDAKHIAAIARARRPRWAESAILKALEPLASEGYTAGQALDTCLRAAADPKAETPVVIPRYAPPPPVATATAGAPRCADHPESYAATCIQCDSEIKRGERLERDKGRRTPAGRTRPEEAVDFSEAWSKIKATIGKGV